jgi:lipoprotein-releasing system permease protein
LSSFEFFVGRRYFKSRRKGSFIAFISILSMAGVAVGVMTLIAVIAVMAGYETEVRCRSPQS